MKIIDMMSNWLENNGIKINANLNLNKLEEEKSHLSNKDINYKQAFDPLTEEQQKEEATCVECGKKIQRGLLSGVDMCPECTKKWIEDFHKNQKLRRKYHASLNKQAEEINERGEIEIKFILNDQEIKNIFVNDINDKRIMHMKYYLSQEYDVSPNKIKTEVIYDNLNNKTEKISNQNVSRETIKEAKQGYPNDTNKCRYCVFFNTDTSIDGSHGFFSRCASCIHSWTEEEMKDMKKEDKAELKDFFTDRGGSTQPINIQNYETKKASLNKQAKIVQLDNGKWQVQSEEGKNLGTSNTKEEAVKRLRAVEYYKNKKGF